MSKEDAFRRAIAETPNDVVLRLIYADWLEEQGDPRAGKVRAEALRRGEAQLRAEQAARERRVVEQQQQRFVRLKRRSHGGVAVAAIIVYLVLSFGLTALAEYLHSRLRGVVYLVRPGTHEWFLFPLLICLCGAVVAAPVILRALVRLLGLDSVAGPNQTAPDMARALCAVRVIAAVFGLVWCGVVVIRLDAYTVFGANSMRINPQSTLGQVEERPYTDVRGLYFIPPVDKDGPRHVIVFADGTSWNTYDGSLPAPPATMDDVMRYVARKTGLVVQTVQSLRDVPRE